MVITRETEIESTVLCDADGAYLGMSLCFGPERVARALMALAEAGESSGPETIPAFVMPIDVPIADALARLVGTLDDELERKLIAPLIIDELLFRLLRSDAAAAVRRAVGQPADAQRILESMQFIRKNHARKLSVDKLASHAAMSPSHYAHRFRAVARVSPMRYLREVRLERARALLCEHGARVSFVATQVGFESAAHFAREFKRRFGTPPSQRTPAASIRASGRRR
jgi:AraC-like DNA-binding protein